MNQYTVTFAAEGKGPPDVQRLRSLLKVSLRRFKLRAVSVAVVKNEAESGKETHECSNKR